MERKLNDGERTKIGLYFSLASLAFSLALLITSHHTLGGLEAHKGSKEGDGPQELVS